MNQAAGQLELGLMRRDRGIASVASHNRGWLQIMRNHARYLAKENGHVSTDDLQKFARFKSLMPTHHNAWGAIFKEPCWYCVGRQKSTRPEANGREIKLWALKGK